MKKIIVLLIFSGIYTTYLNAQSGLNSHLWRVELVPQYLTINGLKFEIQKKLKNPRHWLIVSPSIYYKEYEDVILTDYTYEYDYNSDVSLITTKHIKEARGLGLAIEKRHILTDPLYSESLGFSIAPYFSYGINYHYFELTREDEDWITVPQDGINYMQLGIKSSKTNIHKAGLNFTLGLQAEITEDIVTELYLGCGMRYSSYKGDYKYNKSTSDYGYKGVMLLGGFKIGVGF